MLVAPYKDYDNKYEGFSDYKLDTDLIRRAGNISILHSDDDDPPINRRAHELAQAIDDVHFVELSGYGHFRIGHNMQSEELPPLLSELERD